MYRVLKVKRDSYAMEFPAITGPVYTELPNVGVVSDVTSSTRIEFWYPTHTTLYVRGVSNNGILLSNKV